MGCMRESKSQTVRLKEEILRKLAWFCDRQGTTQQHVVSVGAWFYMCLPANLRQEMNTAFYEWCKAGIVDGGMPQELPPLLKRVMDGIETECSAELDRELDRRAEFENVSNDDALETAPTAEAAADEALAAGLRQAKRRDAGRRGKGRRTA